MYAIAYPIKKKIMDYAIVLGIFVFLVLGLGIGLALQGPRRVINVMEHSYAASKDYERLWQLLINERRTIIVLREQQAYVVHRKDTSDGWTIIGLGMYKEFRNIPKEKFIGYCQYEGVAFLDQIDRYKKYVE